jgi:ADP-ribose pyrophosphatase
MELTLLQRRKLYNGKVFNLIVDDVEYPSGNRGIREVAEHPGGAVAVPILDNGYVVMVRQFRYPIQQHLLELPAGKLSAGEDPLHCAIRELEEETGYRAASWQKLSAIYTTPGFCSEQLHIFLARGVRQSDKGQSLEEGEFTITVEIVPLQHAIDMIVHQEIVDGKTICGLFLAERFVRQQQPK